MGLNYGDHPLSFGNAFMLPLERTLHNVIASVPRLLIALILFVIFCAIAALARQISRRTLEPIRHLPWAIKTLITRSIYLTMLLIGILVALSAANINVTAVIASLGVAGFALGFALKDILENFISGIILLFARPFEVGDQITSGNYEGSVKDIQIRTTTLHTYDNEIVVIPNSQVLTSPVVNHTRLGKRRFDIPFDTSLKADLERVIKEAEQAAKDDPDILDDPAPFVRMSQVQSGIDVLSWKLYVWAAPTQASELQVVSRMLGQIKTRLYDAGVPTPTSTSATILKGPAADHLLERSPDGPAVGKAA